MSQPRQPMSADVRYPASDDASSAGPRNGAGAPRHRRPGPVAWALVRGCRPRQMAKNLLVLTAPALGGHLLTDAAVLPGAVVALLTFCGISAAVYLANDVHDADVDRAHPVKRGRPVASGDLSVPTALGAAAALAVGSLGLALWWTPVLAVVLAGYAVLQAGYMTYLKQVPGVDLGIVSSGFVLRVVAGGVAAPVALEAPFLVVVTFAALFMVAGKRYSELAALGAAAGTRRSLLGYSRSWLGVTWLVAAVIAVMGYVVAAVGMAPFGSTAATWAMASVPAFAAGIVRYARHVRSGRAECPEAVLLADRVLHVLGVLWSVPLGLAVVLA